MDCQISILNSFSNLPPRLSLEKLASTLVDWLSPWGDSQEETQAALEYALSGEPGKGGFLLLAHNGNALLGALVMLDTGMGGYIPRHHLVYVAVVPGARGKGLGEKLVRKGLSLAGTSVSLHIEKDNPALRLYERLGFQTKYLEMRTTSA
jgi:[ribosomal protein S18]-alanine N-acetyltransferase